MDRMKTRRLAKRSALGAAVLASAMFASPFVHAEPITEQQLSYNVVSGETKRNVIAGVSILGAIVCLLFAEKQMRKKKEEDEAGKGS